MSAPTAGSTLLPVATPRAAAALALALLRRRSGAFAAAAVAFVVSAVAGLVGPWQLGRVADLLTDGSSDLGAAERVTTAAVWIAAAAGAGAGATALSVALLARAAEPALADLREQVLDRALALDTARVERAGTGDLLARVGDDVRAVTGSVTDALPLLVGSVLTILATLGGLLALDWRLGLAGLAAAPAYAVALRWYLPRSAPVYAAERVANGERAQALLTGVHASRTLRALGLADRQADVLRTVSWRSARLSVDVFDLLMRFGGRTNRAEAVGLLVVLVTGFVLVREQVVTVGAVTTAALYFHRLFNPVGALLFLFDEVQSAGASLVRLAGVALLPGAPAVAAVAPAAPAAPGGAVAVTLDAVGHRYDGGDVPALTGVTVHVAAGEHLAVVGPSGAGKTTLGLVVAGRLAPTAGTVRLGGGAGRPAGVALVTQEAHVFAGTVADDLRLARPDASAADVDAAVEAVGAAGWVAALPAGLDTPVGDGAAPLTPAQAQQLALARVLLADPGVVVLDEATAEAGSSGARDLDAAAARVARGRTTVTIAHRLVQARAADRVLVLDGGRPVELGTHAELLAAGGLYARLWAAWSYRGAPEPAPAAIEALETGRPA